MCPATLSPPEGRNIHFVGIFYLSLLTWDARSLSPDLPDSRASRMRAKDSGLCSKLPMPVRRPSHVRTLRGRQGDGRSRKEGEGRDQGRTEGGREGCTLTPDGCFLI